MIEQQIEIFSRSLSQLATQYADPSVILQHIPVLKNNLMFQQNPEYIFYGFGALIAALFILKKLAKRRKSRVKNIAMVMPQPYLGDADEAHTDETAPASFEKDSYSGEKDPFAPPATTVSQNQAETARTPSQQLEDVSAIRFAPVTALTPDEARARVMIQAALNEFGAGYLIMARTALSAILQPAQDAVGSERAQAIKAINDKYLDFGVFDRAGRCLVAIDLTSDQPMLGAKAVEKSIVRAAINQASIPLASLSATDRPIDIHTKLSPYLKATARTAALPAPTPRALASDAVSPKPKRTPRPGRPERPVRPVRPIAIAAE